MAAEMHRSGRDGRPHIAALVIIGVVSSAIGIAVALLIEWFPVAASAQAGDIDTLWDVLLIVSVPIFVLVQAAVLYSVWRWRMRPGEEELDGPPIHGSTRLEIVWTALPAILIVALVTYAYVVLRDIEDAQANTMNVRVVGEQFTWTFYYPPAEPGGKEVASSQLYLPVDMPVRFTVQSKDVIHDFWVPAFRLKIDAVPGVDTNFRVTTNRAGNFPVVCAELCGLGHSVMRQTARVLPEDQFRQWLEDRRAGDAAGGGGGGQGGGDGEPVADDGETIFTESAQPACGSCHTLADAGTSGSIGPNLDETLKGKDAAYIREGIADPGAKLASGYQDGIMPPNYGETLTAEQVDALTDYLSEVTSK